MDSSRSVKIGNENFKEWLKILDPLTRVRYMSAIAKSLAKMNLRPCDIKAALAQLSQRCQVMLVRLPEKDIRHHTRRKPLLKVKNSNLLSSPSQNIASYCETATALSSNEYKDTIIGKSSVDSFQNNHNNNPKQKIQTDSPALTTEKFGFEISKSSILQQKKKKKNDKLMRELFGEGTTNDDILNTTVPTNRVKSQSNTEVNNYLSTTVNVNIYNNVYDSTQSNEFTNGKTSLKRKKHSSNAMLKSDSGSKKRLRIDVSLPNEDSYRIESDKSDGLVENNERLQLVKTKKSLQKKSNDKSFNKKKPKKIRQKISTGSSAIRGYNTDDDPSIKELWSMMGMEAPSDRTAKFYSDRLQQNSLETTPHQNLNAADQDKSTQETEVPFLQISNTFSLAENGGEEFNEIDHSNTNIEKEVQKEKSSNITDNDIEEKSKIGTVRLRRLDSLIDPQLHLAKTPTDKNIKSINCSNKLNPDPPSTTDNADVNPSSSSVEERFFFTYTHYFDELVLSKIPKLGELLHLSLADIIRINETIKKAEKLSSEDLIKGERKRAGKEFDNMLRIRGNEFVPLCEVIVKRFDSNSKGTLFIALFWHILNHAATINSINRNFILEAKNVIRLMLEKHNFKDVRIIETLSDSDDEFKDLVIRVGELVSKCVRVGGVITNSMSVTSCPRNTSVTSNVSTVTKGLQGRLNPLVISESQFRELQQQISSQMANRSANDQGKAISTARVQQNGNQNISYQATSIPNSSQTVVQQNSGSTFENSTARNLSLINTLQTALTDRRVDDANTSKRHFSMSNYTVQSGPQQIVSQNPCSLQRQTPTTTVAPRNVPVHKTTLSWLPPQRATPTGVPSTPRKLSSHINLPVLSSTPSVIKSHNTAVPLKHNRVPSTITSGQVRSTTTNLPNAPLQVGNHSVHQQSEVISSPAKPTMQTGTKLPVSSQAINTNQHLAIPPPLNPNLSSNTTISPAELQFATVTVHHRPSTSTTQSGLRNVTMPNDINESRSIVTPERRSVGQVNSTTLVTARNLVGPAVPLGINASSDQPSMTNPREENMSNISNVGIITDRLSISTTISTRPASDPPTPNSPEVTSPTSELNLPSSSHCHPFIARRPISGKMKMLFGSSSNG